VLGFIRRMIFSAERSVPDLDPYLNMSFETKRVKKYISLPFKVFTIGNAALTFKGRNKN